MLAEILIALAASKFLILDLRPEPEVIVVVLDIAVIIILSTLLVLVVVLLRSNDILLLLCCGGITKELIKYNYGVFRLKK